MKKAFKRFLFSLERLIFKKITQSRFNWEIYDSLKIPGFGTNLVRFYFPIYYKDKINQSSFSQVLENEIINLYEKSEEKNKVLDSISQIIEFVDILPVEEKNDITPFLDNYYYSLVDSAVLGSILKQYRPQKVFEIGSGVSTRFIRYFIDRLEMETSIICVDPNPRVNINKVADSILLEPLEDCLGTILAMISKGDIVFLDGSHYVFKSNDTTSFFFNLLPLLPSGVIIHIHDIFLPFDYPEKVERQLWSEQYLLAALVMGGFKGYTVLFPTYYMSKRNETFINYINKSSILQFENKISKNTLREGFSFWMIKD